MDQTRSRAVREVPNKLEFLGLGYTLITPQAQRRGKVIGVFVYMYVYIYIYTYSILHILTIVFPDTHIVKYLPIFNGSYSMALLLFS